MIDLYLNKYLSLINDKLSVLRCEFPLQAHLLELHPKLNCFFLITEPQYIAVLSTGYHLIIIVFDFSYNLFQNISIIFIKFYLRKHLSSFYFVQKEGIQSSLVSNIDQNYPGAQLYDLLIFFIFFHKLVQVIFFANPFKNVLVRLLLGIFRLLLPLLILKVIVWLWIVHDWWKFTFMFLRLVGYCVLFISRSDVFIDWLSFQRFFTGWVMNFIDWPLRIG